ncbi:Hypothetical predicted protein [Lynx pardinus]|uniref:Uncharacterized protein n=1 Tax=Lynx pardinus TaxID=191816 RepID=A0A485MYJ2_LYNPA|nr:Hypothetical predicted protein [Lynx pardinus]
MEILELYCDLLLAWFSLIQATKPTYACLCAVPNHRCTTVSDRIGTQNIVFERERKKLVEGLADLVSIGFTEDVKKGAVDRAGGTLAGTGDPPEASPISALGPFPVRPPASCFLSLPPERQRETEHKWGRDRERRRHRIRSRLQALSYQHRARRGARTHEPQDHDLSHSTGFNLPTSPKPESRSKMGFDNFMPPDLPDEKPQASLSIDPCGSEEVDFEDLNRRLEILKKTTKFLGLGLINCLGIRALQHKC